MKDERTTPWTFRPDPEVEEKAEEAAALLRWSKAELINQALRVGIPLVVEEMRRRLCGPVTSVESKSAAVRAVEKTKKA